MGSLVGFTLCQGLEEGDVARAISAQQRAISYYKHLERKSIEVGRTKLDVWGHPEISDCLHYLPDGDLLILVGSPHNAVPWSAVEEGLLKARHPEEYELPWEGRVVLLRISADGERWTMWNDWIGSIPVYHARVGPGRIASTLEPVVVAGGGYTPDDFFLPGLVSLLIHGNFISDWTLFREMKVVPPDSVATWDESGYRWQQYFSVKPTDGRWLTGWDDLVDEMYELSRQAIRDVFAAESTWILPLSSGLDSRLIAGVAAEIGVDIRTYTWGAKGSSDVIHARQIARALDLPWKWIDIGEEYLVKYTRQWADLFGSAMHFHGMYQMPFLDALVSAPAARVVSGYIGECLAGYDTDFIARLFSAPKPIYQTVPDGYLHWQVKDIPTLLKNHAGEALEEIAFELERQQNALSGPWFQKLRFLTLWGRQRHFTYFQSVLSDYWRGVVTPYLNKEYARFCLSLPRAALDERRLQGDVFRRYFGKLAVIPGTYADVPLIYTGRFLVMRRAAKSVPVSLSQNLFKQHFPAELSLDGVSVRKMGRKALWPIDEAVGPLQDWLDNGLLEKTITDSLGGDIISLRKLQPIQSLAFRLLSSTEGKINS